jgi:hypothetical protein
VRLLVAALVVIVVLVLFNLPQLTNLQPRKASGSPTGTSPQPARQVAPAGSGGNFTP